MIRPLAAYVARLDSVYRDRPYFSGLKARLLAVFSLVVMISVPVSIAKLFWLQPPGLPLRCGVSLLIGAAALTSLRLLLKGRLELAGNVLVVSALILADLAVLLTHPILQPLSVAIQLFILGLLCLLCAIVFSSRRFAVVVLILAVATNLAFYALVLRPEVLAGTTKFAARTLLGDGLITFGLIFCLGFTLVRMIDSAHRRSEDSLRQSRLTNENLEQLVAARTRDLEAATQRASEASRAKSEFLANVSHEIRTPLNGIIAAADLLRHRADLAPEAGDHAKLISESGDLLLRLLSDVLDFSKIEAGQLELERHAFELNAIVMNTVALVATKAALSGVQIDTAVAADLSPYFEGDSYRLRQVLLNLLSNAIKFTPAGGRVVLSVTGSVPRDGQTPVRFEIRDSGIGMDEPTLKRIFERFTQADSTTTRRFGGTGLGLAISSRLVQMMGGQLEVESALGQGSVFYFTVPIRPIAALTAAAPAPDAQRTRLHLRVAVAEDNAVNQRILGAQLTQLGCRYSMAANGEEILAALQQGPLPDVVLMDCQMPKLDGWEATRRIRGWARDSDPRRKKASAIPIIALTAAAMNDERARCLDAGMNDFLAKPLKMAELHRVLLTYARAPELSPG